MRGQTACEPLKGRQMNVGLVRRSLPKDAADGNYPESIAKALTTAGHATVLFTAGEPEDSGRDFGKIRAVGGTTSAEFARRVEAANPRGECDFLFSFEPGLSCDCYLAAAGVHRERIAQWKRQTPIGWWCLGKRRPGADNGLLALEAKTFQPDVTKTVVTSSHRVKDEIIRHYTYPADRIRVIRDAIQPVDSTIVRKKRHDTRRQLGLTGEDYVIYCGGPGLSAVEFRYAIEAINCTNLSQPVLLAGCSDNRWRYPRSSRTRFVGSANPGLSHLYAADLFLQPSVYDPISHPCLAAFAAGLPVVTTRANGVSEMIEPGTHGELLSEPSDAEAMARAIEAWSDPEKRAAVRPRLLEFSAKFDPDVILNSVISLVYQGATTCPSA